MTVNTQWRYGSSRNSCSITVALKLLGTPLRVMMLSFKWEVLISRTGPLNVPVENPSQLCAAYDEGRARSSSQIMRAPAVLCAVMRYATICRLIGSSCLSISTGSSAWGWYVGPRGRHCSNGDVDTHSSEYVSARIRAA